MHTSASLSWPKGPSLSVGWLGTSWLAWTSSSCLVQRNIPGPVLRLGSQAAYPTFCPVRLDVHQWSPTDALTCSSCWHHGHRGLSDLWSLLPLLAAQARRPLWSTSSCLQKHLRTEQGAPFLGVELEIGLNERTRQMQWYCEVWILTAVPFCCTVGFSWCDFM